MSLLFNMLSRFVITFLPGNKHLLISWLQSLSTVILDPRKLSLSLFPILRQVDKKSGVPEEEKGVWGSWGTNFFSILLCFSHIRFVLSSELLWQQSLTLIFFKPRANDYTTKQLILLKGVFFLKLCANDYMTTMYLAQGHVSSYRNLLTNLVILRHMTGSGKSM